MFKKFVLLPVIMFFVSFNGVFLVWASEQPGINCAWLPGCHGDDIIDIDGPVKPDISLIVIVDFVENFMQFVAVFAVFALIFSWIMFLISSGDEEKTKKAKSWIIYSLVWVFVSTSAWWIINLLNNIRIWL